MSLKASHGGIVMELLIMDKCLNEFRPLKDPGPKESPRLLLSRLRYSKAFMIGQVDVLIELILLFCKYK